MGLNESQKKERSEYLEHNLDITECSQKKPYVFISYASDNWERVFKNAVVPMQKQYGLRVYADKAFDTVNDKWIVPMLRNIRGSDVIIAFVSQNYIESYACFLELLTAVNNKKQIVFVSLEDQLHLGDTTDQPNVERGVKNEILNQGANIATNTNNTSNDIMRAMKSAYTSISTLLEQDALSKYDISDAFINFFRDASINRKTINDLGAVKGTVESVSGSVFDKSLIAKAKPEKVPVMAAKAAVPVHPVQSVQSAVQTEVPKSEPVQQPVQQAAQAVSAADTSGVKLKTDTHGKKFKIIIAAAAAVCCLAVAGIAIGVSSPKNVSDMSYSVNVTDAGGIVHEYSGTYTGKWKKDMPYGEGDFTYNDGIYSGEWENGKQSGHGTVEFTNGDVYEGKWQDGKRNGQGTLTYADGDEYNRVSYEGEWKDDKKDGQATEKYASGDVYEGEFNDDFRHGQGTYTFANGNVYEGEWKDGKRCGQGTLKWSDGTVYEGEWENNKCNGQGTMTYADGAVYEGEFKDNLYNGQGKMTYADGGTYTGEWKDGKRSGQGTREWSNGVSFTGEWENDEYVNGIMKYEDNSTYEGEFKDGDKYNGQGKKTYADGRVYEGEWKDSKYNGQGKIVYDNGTIYEGEWKDGTFDGQGRMEFTNGDVYEGGYKDGLRHGQGVYTYADGTVKTGTWQDGEFVE